jgi:type I restriction enzyme R subunit
MLKQLMTDGLKVDGGTKLGKTIIFAKNHKHAEFIEERFNICFPNLVGSFARIIDNKVKYAQSLIDDFSIAEEDPQIAISVDMMDTGIDVPEVVNLVFYKVVCSKTKFFQMIGRGTRLCEDLFAPDEHKENFLIFDYCGNFEFFRQNPEGSEGATGDPLDKRNFRYRVEILRHLKNKKEEAQGVEEEAGVYKKADFKSELTSLLHSQVTGMDYENILVRPHWEHVERFQTLENWNELDDESYSNLNRQVAGLPSTEDMGIIEAQYFDSLILKGQLSILERDTKIIQVKKRVMEIGAKLQEKASIPQVNENLELIIEIQSDDFWQDVTLEMLENVRKKLRNLMKLIDKKNRKIVVTDFEDEFQEMEEVDVGGLTEVIDKKQYKKKVQKYLKEHLDHIVLKKLHYHEPLTKMDLGELERFLFEATEFGDREHFEECYGKQENLPLFIRSLIGMDRNAAKEAFSQYLDSSRFNANQIDFINLVIDNLSQNGIIDPKSLVKEMPFTSINEKGILGLFPMEEAQKVIKLVNELNSLDAV